MRKTAQISERGITAARHFITQPPCAANRRPGGVAPDIRAAAQNRYIPATNTTPENSSVVTQ